MDLDDCQRLHPSFEPADGLLLVEFDHGKANEIGTAELTALERLCERIDASQDVVCVVSFSRRHTTKGTPVFVAGADVTERDGWDRARVLQHVDWQRSLMIRWRRLPVFTIALVHGAALGWGLEFCLAHDVVLATRTATFGLPETGLGLVPGAGGTADLATRVGRATALRLGCLGDRIDAEEAHGLGLVDETLADVDAGLSRVRTMAAALRRRSPSAVAAYKHCVLAGEGLPMEERMALERSAYAHLVDLGDAETGRRAFGEIRAGIPPTWAPRRRWPAT